MTTSRDKINPDKKPLEDLTILMSDEGVQKKVPALSLHFVGDRPMTPFLLPPSMNENGTFDRGEKEEWFHKMEIFKANLQWLLGLPHHRFWSQIVYGKKTWDSVISYLQEAYPFFAIHRLPDDYEIRERYNEISHLVFCVICRVSTQVESEDAWIGKAKYCELLYDSTIVSLPILCDMCVVFGNDNKEEISHIITNIFSIQPLYKEDLDALEKHLKNVLSTIEDKFLGSHIKPPDLQYGRDSKMGISDIYDLSFYILDTIATLYSFIDAYPEGAMILHLHTFEVSLAQFYDKVYPSLLKRLQELVSASHPSYETLLFTINQSRVYVLKLFYLIIQSSLNTIIENRFIFPEELLKFNAESFLNVINECIKSSKTFMKDYQKTYPLEQDLDVLSQIYPEINNDKFRSILDDLRTTCSVSKPKNVKPSTSSNSSSPVKKPNNDPKGEVEVHSSSTNSSEKVNLFLISEVKDVLPHLGEGFIMKCLEHYNFKSSDVINAVLENALPDSLLKLDPELPIIPPEPGVSDEKGSILSQRINVFDNDEFDVMNRDDIDTSKIHQGKRTDSKDAVQLLDDKSFREDLRDQFTKLGIVESMDNVYDDEYDDTYDDTAVPIEEEEEAERKFVVPRILQQQKDKETRGNRADYEEDDDDNEMEPDRRQTNGFVPFAENPEVVRARREQARMSKQRGQAAPPPKRDVVGNARGQGQESDTLRNRSKKNTNKSTYGNHNRKKGAQYKRSQGFIPS